jgi:hypothetical protein
VESYAPAPVPVEEPRYEAPRAEERPVEAAPRVEVQRVEAPRYETPKIDPKELLESAGLVMIETDRAKAPPSQPVEEEPQRLGRPRRERPKTSESDDLVQIETGTKK